MSLCRWAGAALLGFSTGGRPSSSQRLPLSVEELRLDSSSTIPAGRACRRGRPVPGWVRLGVISPDVTRFTNLFFLLLTEYSWPWTRCAFSTTETLPSWCFSTCEHCPAQRVLAAVGRGGARHSRGMRSGAPGPYLLPQPPAGPVGRSNKTTHWPG